MNMEMRPLKRDAGTALAAKRGEVREGDLRGASRNMYETLTENELAEMAGVDLRDVSARSRDRD
ncbi:DUF3008 family protein [Celeribacter indicus]|uniref:Uncharacterized protein n=1 Tax=Celeribacter indicus TaxID=1208324 RepID=A0A0B5E6C8_9RHOB|nr:DUF3008 family protein [Celeribacter indicus]AJE47882.1 hypothetical protein P73_3167 [Celeribacter indicus]SDW25932.1 Protein of unknwon function [Celeribacter indicus]